MTPTGARPSSARSIVGLCAEWGGSEVGTGPLGDGAVGSTHTVPLSPQGSARGDGRGELWVTKWVDYSSKYGVGYKLSDGSLGVYFNDSTKIILIGDRFDYITRRTQEKPEVRSSYTFENYPEDLKKKVTLLRHFGVYMTSDVTEKKDGVIIGKSFLPDRLAQRPLSSSSGDEVVYVKKWTRNRHAVLFQLSNKVVQVVFFDKTEALLSTKQHTVTYVDKEGQVSEYPLSNALDVPNAELARRLRCTRDILMSLPGMRAGDVPGTGS